MEPRAIRPRNAFLPFASMAIAAEMRAPERVWHVPLPNAAAGTMVNVDPLRRTPIRMTNVPLALAMAQALASQHRKAMAQPVPPTPNASPAIASTEFVATRTAQVRVSHAI